MKCDELKPLVFSLKDFAYIDEPAAEKNFENPHDHAVYKATEVDAAIAELKDAWRSEHEACEALKAKLENVQASMYADVVDANMEIRRLRRVLYKACTNWAHFAVAFFSSYATKEKWRKMENKCLKKAEEYK